MMSALAATVTGVVLALFAVVGGVSAISPTPNAPAASENVVVYDAP
ncbi:hypothetical protein N802_17180 [Knoellia sinensis KCTC 19936]|uniref:Uncharacterized protein n=1 Tax=Knoellia sinensis KCTC 19936 TaxID=1385520 RepID=A0A0A0JAP6_9MICO|nr:hypothetical protein [Knoellia sinensis]KGN32691.1 hypothetical protein N802_17180 [Knoellia sinensis KCTC 19936]